jgi:hypothetical protein
VSQLTHIAANVVTNHNVLRQNPNHDSSGYGGHHIIFLLVDLDDSKIGKSSHNNYMQVILFNSFD